MCVMEWQLRGVGICLLHDASRVHVMVSSMRAGLGAESCSCEGGPVGDEGGQPVALLLPPQRALRLLHAHAGLPLLGRVEHDALHGQLAAAAPPVQLSGQALPRLSHHH